MLFLVALWKLVPEQAKADTGRQGGAAEGVREGYPEGYAAWTAQQEMRKRLLPSELTPHSSPSEPLTMSSAIPPPGRNLLMVSYCPEPPNSSANPQRPLPLP